MRNFDYVTPTRLIFGEGVISELPAVMKPFGKRVLLTYGGGSIKRMGLYDKVKDNPNFKGFVYFSDHGEDVENNYGHEASKFTPVMSRIPLFMIFSPAFRAERPQTVQALQQHRDSYWTNHLVYNVMTDLMGIEGVPGSDADWDLASPQYSMDKGNLRTLHNGKPLP